MKIKFKQREVGKTQRCLDECISYMRRQYRSSLPLNSFDREKLKFYVYGTAYVNFNKVQDKYDLIDVTEHIENSLIDNTQTVVVTLTLQEKNQKGE